MPYGLPGAVMTPPLPQDIPQTIGPYRLQAFIGEGGVGAVFLAEQQEPVRRAVAVKILRATEVSAEGLRRFYKERRALALMTHHNITQVYDAGALPDGRPYLVMEYVPGRPITDFCEAHRLSLAQRARLFLQVCRAIQHAHEKGVIHRDLKPKNALVYLEDGAPVAKVVDFGVAKAPAALSGEESAGTLQGPLPGDPVYMSPEQLTGEREAVDIRSDVYALGVMLYEIIAGATPLDFRRAPMNALQRAANNDWPRPSEKLRAVPDLEALAAARQTTPRRLLHQVSGPLDWIVGKALQADPEQRCPSAGALDLMLQRYLDGEPVEGMPAAPGQRLRRFFTRHGLGWAGVALMTAALITAAYGGVWGWRAGQRAEEAVAARLAQADRYERETRAVERLLAALTQNSRAAELTTREALAFAETLTPAAAGPDPDAHAALLRLLGETRLARGEPAPAIRCFSDALTLCRERLAPDHPAIVALADALARARAAQASPATQGRRP